jgi:hypothetical protein
LIAEPQRRDVWPEGRGGGGDLVDVVSARAEALDQAAEALDVIGGADRIALGVVHSKHDGFCTGFTAGLARRLRWDVLRAVRPGGLRKACAGLIGCGSAWTVSIARFPADLPFTPPI